MDKRLEEIRYCMTMPQAAGKKTHQNVFFPGVFWNVILDLGPTTSFVSPIEALEGTLCLVKNLFCILAKSGHLEAILMRLNMF